MGDGVQRGDPSLPWSTWDVLTIDPSKVLGVLGRVLMGWRIIEKQKGKRWGAYFELFIGAHRQGQEDDFHSSQDAWESARMDEDA